MSIEALISIEAGALPVCQPAVLRHPQPASSRWYQPAVAVAVDEAGAVMILLALVPVLALPASRR